MDSEFNLIRCSIESFMKAYLPFVPNIKETEHFVRQLLQQSSTEHGAGNNSHHSGVRKVASVLTGNETSFAFRDYPLKKHKAGKRSNSKIAVFRGWEKIAQSIGNIEYPGKRKRNRFNYVNVPNKCSNNNRIDAALVAACDKEKPLQTTDIAVVVGHKLAWSQHQQNSLQAVSANSQIMNDDVRRMFTFGITAERQNVTLWYHGRSHSAASYPFNFSENPKLFIQILIAFSFATEEELGYDPMVKLEPDGHYTFKLPKLPVSDEFRLFRTVEGLSLYHSSNIVGRMTRVYKVLEVNESGESFGDPLVLKDVWLENSAKTEKEMQDAIFTDIERFWDSTDEPPELKTFKEAHEEIWEKTKLPVKGGTEIRGLLAAEPDLAPHVPQTGTKSQGSQFLKGQASVDTHPTVSQTSNSPAIPPDSSQRKQYRVLFKEVCITTGRLETLGELVSVLSQTLIPLQLLFCAGWVHRDISSGNILAFKENLESKGPWLAKLSDLEYAKKFPLPQGSACAADRKIGTPYFMPLEVMMSSYLFSVDHDNAIMESIRSAQQASKPDRHLAIKERLAKFAQKLQEPKTAVSEPGVVHNFQHDLESIWWILFWNICCRLHPEQSTQSLQDFGRAIFVNEMKPTYARKKCITETSFGASIVANVPESIYSLFAYLLVLREELYHYYVTRGRKGAYNDVGSYAEIHHAFFYTFKILDDKIAEALETQASDKSDGGDLHWPNLSLAVKNYRNPIAEGSAVAKPERKRPRSNEDHVDAREVESEGSTKAKYPRRK